MDIICNESQRTLVNNAIAYLAKHFPNVHRCVCGENRVSVIFGDKNYWSNRSDNNTGTCVCEAHGDYLSATIHIRTTNPDGSDRKIRTSCLLHEFIHAAAWISGNYFTTRDYGKALGTDEIVNLTTYARNSIASGEYRLIEEAVAEYMVVRFNADMGVESAKAIVAKCPKMDTWLRMYEVWAVGEIPAYSEVYNGRF